MFSFWTSSLCVSKAIPKPPLTRTHPTPPPHSTPPHLHDNDNDNDHNHNHNHNNNNNRRLTQGCPLVCA